MRTKLLWTYCLYSRFWERVRHNAKRCPRCGAALNNGTYPLHESDTNPNPEVDPKEANSPLAS
jgi:hypothetical protein